MELQESKPKMTADKRILLDTIKVRIMDKKRISFANDVV